MSRLRYLTTRTIAATLILPSFSVAFQDSDNYKPKVSTDKSSDLHNILILPGTGHTQLAANIASNLGVQLGSCDIKRFSDGEVSCTINENVRGRDVFIIQTCHAPVNDSVMELLLTISNCRRSGANRVVAVIPYFGYRYHRRGSTMSTKHHSRFLWSASSDFAKMLQVMGVDRVISVDLQRPGQGQEACFFDNFIPVETASSTNLMVDYFADHVPLRSPIVVVSQDSECTKKARKFQNGLLSKGKFDHVGLAAFIHAEHHTGPVNPNHAELLGNVAGADVIIVDDLVDTAGTLSILCRRLIKEGANRVYLCASHGLFTKNSLELIRLSPVEKVVVSDTLPLPSNPGNKIEQVSVVPLLARLIESEYYRSVRKLVDDDEYVVD